MPLSLSHGNSGPLHTRLTVIVSDCHRCMLYACHLYVPADLNQLLTPTLPPWQSKAASMNYDI